MNDHVNHPKHYTQHPSKIECIEITEHFDFLIGNVIKYCWRAGLKGGSSKIQDLKKAEFYIKRAILKEEELDGEIDETASRLSGTRDSRS